MSDEAALLAAIIANPDDDTVRLVYADWLDENGRSERAEFIRVQIAVARTPADDQCAQCYAVAEKRQHTNGPCRCTPELRSLRKRSRELHERIGYAVVNTPREWSVSMTLGAADDGDGTGRLSIRRGFVEWWRMPAAAWLEHGDAIRAAHPVTRVKLTTNPARLCELSCDAAAYFRVRVAGRTFELSEADYRDHLDETDRDGWAPLVLRLRWPGVTFETPTTRRPRAVVEQIIQAQQALDARAAGGRRRLGLLAQQLLDTPNSAGGAT